MALKLHRGLGIRTKRKKLGYQDLELKKKICVQGSRYLQGLENVKNRLIHGWQGLNMESSKTFAKPV